MIYSAPGDNRRVFIYCRTGRNVVSLSLSVKTTIVKRLLHDIAKYFLPVLFLSYIGCISLFTHTHVVNGVTIVHSHPYQSGGGHEHTTAEFQLIHLLSNITTPEPAMWLFFAAVLFAYSCRLYLPAYSFYSITEEWRAHGLRAPPVSIL